MKPWVWCAILLPTLLLTNPRSNAHDQQTLATSSTCYEGDQLVVVSTRNYPSSVGCTLDFESLVAYAIDTTGPVRVGKTDLLQNNRFAETWVFVHGNQITPQMAIDRGAKVYRNLRAKSVNDMPIQFVIWSWPSERTGNRIADARIKAKRTDAESFYLGSYLAEIASNGPVSLIGYSFGARVVSGGLHLNAGGSLCGYYLPQASVPVEPYRVVFLAAAVENDGLLDGGRYQNALAHTNRLLLQNNSKDKALRFFWVTGRSRPTALGHSGLCCAPQHCQVRQYDWAEVVKNDHSVWQYMDRDIILRRSVDTISHLP